MKIQYHSVSYIIISNKCNNETVVKMRIIDKCKSQRDSNAKIQYRGCINERNHLKLNT